MELNKDNKIESRFKEQIAILNTLIDLEDWIKYYLDLYFSFELMANYITETIQLKNLINNELYKISKKLSKLLAKEDLTYYVQERHRYPNIIKLIKENKDFGVNSFFKDSFYKETIAEFYIILDIIEIDIEYIDLYIKNYNELKEDGVRPENINGIIKKLHPTLINTFKILSYLDYLNFLKKIEKKPKIVEKELEHKKVTSTIKLKESKAKALQMPKKTPDIIKIEKYNELIGVLFDRLKTIGHINCKKNEFNQLFNGTEISKIKLDWLQVNDKEGFTLLRALFEQIYKDYRMFDKYYYCECFQIPRKTIQNNKVTKTTISKASELLR